jgi:hypothetical protein
MRVRRFGNWEIGEKSAISFELASRVVVFWSSAALRMPVFEGFLIGKYEI